MPHLGGGDKVNGLQILDTGTIHYMYGHQTPLCQIRWCYILRRVCVKYITIIRTPGSIS